jgi:hypothetical protein
MVSHLADMFRYRDYARDHTLHHNRDYTMPHLALLGSGHEYE